MLYKSHNTLSISCNFLNYKKYLKNNAILVILYLVAVVYGDDTECSTWQSIMCSTQCLFSKSTCTITDDGSVLCKCNS